MSEVEPLLEVVSVAKSYAGAAGAIEVLKNATFQVRNGESLAITGPSGSGKSTLLHILGSLDRPTAGAVRFAGRDLAQLTDRQRAEVRAREIGFIFQQHYLLPQCTVLENVLVPTLVAGGAAGATDRARRFLNRVGLSQRESHRPGALSVGECQRVAAVRALINRPRLLLADEPTGSLDRAGADALGALLLELNREEQVAMVVVTHSERLAERLQRVLTLRDGVLLPPRTSA
jgi:lipoprotein-releasing system ATP-binding protein